MGRGDVEEERRQEEEARKQVCVWEGGRGGDIGGKYKSFSGEVFV